ncbi:unnamed protein product, partial [Symbiodinium pilosum]
MPLTSIHACKRSLRVARAQYNRGIGDLREGIRRRNKAIKKSRNGLRKLEAKVQELGGELSEEMSDYSSPLGDTASESESGTNSHAEKVEPASSKEQAVPKKKAVAKSSPKAEALPAEIKKKDADVGEEPPESVTEMRSIWGQAEVPGSEGGRGGGS